MAEPEINAFLIHLAIKEKFCRKPGKEQEMNWWRKLFGGAREAATSGKGKADEKTTGLPGEKVARTGTYKCGVCGPDGLYGGTITLLTPSSVGEVKSTSASTKFFREGETFSKCPGCLDLARKAGSPIGSTGAWVLVSEEAGETPSPGSDSHHAPGIREFENEVMDLLKQKDWPSAIARCSSWLEHRPDDFLGIKLLASAYARSGQADMETSLYQSYVDRCAHIKPEQRRGTPPASSIDQIQQFVLRRSEANTCRNPKGRVILTKTVKLGNAPNEMTGSFVYIELSTDLFDLGRLRTFGLDLDYVPTDSYPLLWFRALIEDESSRTVTVESFLDIGNKDDLSNILEIITGRKAIVGFANQTKKLVKMAGYSLDSPSQTTRFLAQVCACKKEHAERFQQAGNDAFRRAQKELADRYDIEQQW